MCGTGNINVQDFKAHAVIVGGSWHFREKVSHKIFIFFSLLVFCNQDVWACLFWVATGDEVVLGRGVQLHPGGASSSAAVHHRLLSAAPGRIQHPLPLLPDHRCTHTQHAAHRTHVVSKKTQADVLIWSGHVSDTAGHSFDISHGIIDLMDEEKCFTGSHVWFLLNFGERLTFPQGASFLKIQGLNQGCVACHFSFFLRTQHLFCEILHFIFALFQNLQIPSATW